MGGPCPNLVDTALDLAKSRLQHGNVKVDNLGTSYASSSEAYAYV